VSLKFKVGTIEKGNLQRRKIIKFLRDIFEDFDEFAKYLNSKNINKLYHKNFSVNFCTLHQMEMQHLVIDSGNGFKKFISILLAKYISK